MTMLWVGTSRNSLTAVSPDPSSLSWGLQDVSASTSGRTHDANTTMYKERLSQKVKLDLSWTMLRSAQAQAILLAFNPEYIWVKYFDPLQNALVTKQFYVGDRTAPFKRYRTSSGALIETLSFNIIER